ncbi:hypothetical protein CEB38_02840 [Acinetobacter baumannii]|nr:hypothetical protein CEB38_02840 [Acinetobacter baumannii]
MVNCHWLTFLLTAAPLWGGWGVGVSLTVLAKFGVAKILRKCALIQGELCEAKSKSNKALFGFFDFARCARFLDLSRFHEVEHFSCLWWCILRKIG